MGRIEYEVVSFGNSPYASDIVDNLSALFDIAINACGFPGEQVVDAFVISGMARDFERQVARVVSGKSATELVVDLLPFLGSDMQLEEGIVVHPSPEYWLGRSLALYQLATGRSYRRVLDALSYEELLQLYWPLHEADASKFIDVVEGRLRDAARPTNLQMLRKAAQLSQAELAERSGVGLRSIQMYEQRNKSINHASAEAVYRLAFVLSCRMEDVMEL